MTLDDRASARREDPVVGSAWISHASYWMPRHIVQSAWLEHAPFAFWMIDALRPSSYVELGTHNGFSFFTACDAVTRLGLDTACSALDSWEGDDQAGFYGEDVYQSVLAIRDAEYPRIATLLRGYFSDSVDRIPDGSVDLLHIDGRHGYEDALEDWTAYAPKLSARGVVMFHDTFEFDRGFGVHRLWAELAAQFPERSFQFEHGHGLGVIGVGADLPAPVVEFFQAAQSDGPQIESDYHWLGKQVSAHYERDLDYRNQLHLAEVERASLRAEAEAADASRAVAVGELDAIRTSTSWRLTSPLRKAVGVLRRR
ncbi:class I SAM-dependent methyltransferase [Plantibacter sp. VKM Ac-2885]|uniref:class I SAM-dependent methyltransferase n=1 Tax=Plantibacter TaxID=190323 RepID=UPI0010C1D80D|nr:MULTISPECIES: class I SAM-dependent methyltransferase [Plantibacter]MBD8103566.1 class I SAM-dependent methyltransferase [Plantibacter sp. CFBP 8775]MBD8516580.1 class I SAM-dependent methyltransferase [Plantibacter sp. CFBP 8804]MBF4514383.1 class I SAM-dependent methyltransferase [Plantibacter sp. VKM Ac-2885]TKJ96526.1 hypothetical protein PlfCFBP13513_13795 [Plantibacter flavus]